MSSDLNRKRQAVLKIFLFEGYTQKFEARGEELGDWLTERLSFSTGPNAKNSPEPNFIMKLMQENW